VHEAALAAVIMLHAEGCALGVHRHALRMWILPLDMVKHLEIMPLRQHFWNRCIEHARYQHVPKTD
jgi:thiosulfate reductase cytochrome b subunit